MTTDQRPLGLPLELDMSPHAQPELREPAAVTVFPGVHSRLHLQFACTPGYRPLTLDLHVPDADTPPPVVVYGHGGGFFAGTKAMGPWRFLLDAGFAVASVDYRLSGEARFPGPVHDMAAAVRFLRARAAELGVDGDRIIGFGSSAGGYLLNAVALAGDDPAMVGMLGATPEVSSRLLAVVDHYAPTDFLHIDDDAPADVVEVSDAPGSSASRFFGFVPSQRPEEAAVATLSRYVTGGAPPFLIFHGDDDHRVGLGQSRRLHEALTAAGARSELVVVPGADHGTPHFDQEPVHRQTLAFLASVLHA